MPWRFYFLRKEGDVIKLLAQYVIPLDPRTKKNHMTIAGSGPRCKECGKRKKQYVRQGHANTQYSARAAQYLHPKPREPLECEIYVVYHLYMQTHRRVDDLNLYASLDDLLVSERIIRDDSIKYIRCRDGSRVFYDKENPRAEIYIYEYREEEDNGIPKRNEDVHG